MGTKGRDMESGYSILVMSVYFAVSFSPLKMQLIFQKGKTVSLLHYFEIVLPYAY